jgi:hypothetical protein
MCVNKIRRYTQMNKISKINNPLYDALVDYINSKSKAFQSWKNFFGNKKNTDKAIYHSLMPSIFSLFLQEDQQ